MDVTIHWQDADSSSAKAVRAPRLKSCCVLVILVEKFWKNVRKITKEEYQSCKCVVYHSSGCGCLSDTFISKASLLNSTQATSCSDRGQESLIPNFACM